MNPWTQLPHRTPGRFRVGECVRVDYAGGIEAEILEDHGPIGVGGRRLYTLLLKNGDNDTIGGYPEEYMEPLASANGSTSPG